MITPDETKALEILTLTVRQLDAELQRQMAARASVIALLEAKYDSVFNEQTGIFTPKAKVN